jgi:uncharacterized protein YkwD
MSHLPRTLALLCVVALVGSPAAAARPPLPLNARIVVALNVERAARGLPRLHSSAGLNAAARSHSREMLLDGYFDHDSFDGTSFWRRINGYYDAQAAGENLLESSPDVSARRAVALWMASPEHRRNVLDPMWRDVGISAVHALVARSIFGGGPVTVVTADFASRRDG